jgi:hypothetical protein
MPAPVPTVERGVAMSPRERLDEYRYASESAEGVEVAAFGAVVRARDR